MKCWNMIHREKSSSVDSEGMEKCNTYTATQKDRYSEITA